MQEILNYCKENSILEKNDGIVVGFSGGADSVCLVHFLLSVREQYALKLVAVHVHHGLRGEEADRDADFCRQFCKEHDVAYEEYRVDVPSYKEENGLTEEEAGRELRYRCFAEVCDAYGYGKIAVAHHKNDVAETMLFHMARGTGLQGLAPMVPVSDNVIRPLLCLTKQEITDICEKEKLAYCEDSTNADTSYARNRIRSMVLPELEKINEKTVEHLSTLAFGVSEVNRYLERAVEELISIFGEQEEDSCLLRLEMWQEDNVYIRRLVYQEIIFRLTGRKKDIGAKHLEAIDSLLHTQSGKSVTLPYGLFVRREHDALFFGTEAEKAEPVCHEITVPGQLALSDGSTLTAELIEKPSGEIPKKIYTKYFDYDKITDSLQLRTPEDGDYISIDAERHTKKLNRLFIDMKIPVHERCRQLVVAEGSHVLWLIGGRVSNDYMVTAQTEQVLMLTFTEEN